MLPLDVERRPSSGGDCEDPVLELAESGHSFLGQVGAGKGEAARTHQAILSLRVPS